MSTIPASIPASYPAENIGTRLASFMASWLPAILLVLGFAIESTAAFGSDHTSAPLHRLLQAILNPRLRGLLDANWDSIHHLLRKFGHFVAYGLFSLVTYQGLRRTLRLQAAEERGRLICQALGVAATCAVACADEIHQTFLPNRTGCFSDVVLDTCGAIVFQIALMGLFRLRLGAKLSSPREALPLDVLGASASA